MTSYEYKVIPAPAKGRKAAGIKGAEARFAHALEQRINELAADGWQYLRADILPSEERQGLTSTQTVYRSVLVFQRAVGLGTAADDLAADEVIADTAETEEPAPEEPTDAADETGDSTDDDVPQDPPEDDTKKEVSP